jgi:hypothetical protein
MRIFIVGGSGLVGGLILPALCDQYGKTPTAVSVFDLKPPSSPLLADRCQVTLGSVTDPVALANAFAGFGAGDVLVYLVMGPLGGASIQAYKKVNNLPVNFMMVLGCHSLAGEDILEAAKKTPQQVNSLVKQIPAQRSIVNILSINENSINRAMIGTVNYGTYTNSTYEWNRLFFTYTLKDKLPVGVALQRANSESSATCILESHRGFSSPQTNLNVPENKHVKIKKHMDFCGRSCFILHTQSVK